MKKLFAVLWVLILNATLFARPLLSTVAVEEEEVVFSLKGVSAGKVFLVGDFNGWNPTMDLMAPTENGFEIRLYLLPGDYRYRFVIDGEAKADPDNPCRDAQGNSCFALAEKNGALVIALAERAATRGTFERTDVAPKGKIASSASDERASLFSTATITGTIDEKIGIDASVGWTEENLGGTVATGKSFLLGSAVSYRSERGKFTAFSRAPAAIEPGDPLGLFGIVGPYRYPLGLFCRGGVFDGTLPLGVDAWLLYASRLVGYRSGLEGVASSSDLFSRRDLVDADLIGMRLGAKLGKTSLRYVFRQDRRPKEGEWRFPAWGNDLYRGYERGRIQGFWLSLSGDAPVTVDGELLFGRNFISATERLGASEAGRRDVSLESIWERGRRMCIGVSHTGEMLRSRLSLTETTLEGDRAARDGRPDGARTAMDAALSFNRGSLSMDAEGRIEQYSALNAGEIFWLSRTNFWLDGDEISYDLIPFLSSQEIYEVKLGFSWKYEPLKDLPWGKGLRLSMVQRGDQSDGSAFFREITLSNGTPIHPRVTFLLDMRAASYRCGNLMRDFIDAFLSVHGRITSSLWCACGVGVNPYAFDRWLYAFSDHGRAEYLAAQGVFRDLAAHGEAASVKTLIDAEETLSEDRVVTFEAGFTF